MEFLTTTKLKKIAFEKLPNYNFFKISKEPNYIFLKIDKVAIVFFNGLNYIPMDKKQRVTPILINGPRDTDEGGDE